MSNVEELHRLMDRLVSEKTLSGDGIQAFAEMRTKVHALETEISNYRAKLTDRDREIDKLKLDAQDMSKRLDKFLLAENAMFKREAEVTALEKKTAVAEAKSATYLECMGIIFRPNQIRENLWNTTSHLMPASFPGGQSYVQQSTDGKQIVREEG